jgi:hypothetical protein
MAITLNSIINRRNMNVPLPQAADHRGQTRAFSSREPSRRRRDGPARPIHAPFVDPPPGETTVGNHI